MPLSISFDDLRKQCHIDDPKKFKRWLEVEFRVLKDYPKRTADEIASRLGQKIHWDEYRIHERSDGDDGALRLGISMDLADTIERWYSQLMGTNPTPTARYDYMLGIVCAGGFLGGGDSREFVINLTPSMNVLIGARGSGKSTVLNLLGMVAGSLKEEADILVKKLVNLAESGTVERSEFERRVRKTLRDYGVQLFASFFCRNGTMYCCIVLRDESKLGSGIRIDLFDQDQGFVSASHQLASIDAPVRYRLKGILILDLCLKTLHTLFAFALPGTDLRNGHEVPLGISNEFGVMRMPDQ